jgi:hypothetical protein
MACGVRQSPTGRIGSGMASSRSSAPKTRMPIALPSLRLVMGSLAVEMAALHPAQAVTGFAAATLDSEQLSAENRI